MTQIFRYGESLVIKKPIKRGVAMAEDTGFKVNDRRFSAGNTDSPKKAEPNPKQGDGFTMKEAPAEAEAAPFKIDFSTFVFSLATGSLINMGLAPDPTTNQVQKNLDLARQNIELLALIKEKTKGNLTAEEDKLLENLLTEVRLRFVEASKK